MSYWRPPSINHPIFSIFTSIYLSRVNLFLLVIYFLSQDFSLVLNAIDQKQVPLNLTIGR